jgi:hypothetical protein
MITLVFSAPKLKKLRMFFTFGEKLEPKEKEPHPIEYTNYETVKKYSDSNKLEVSGFGKRLANKRK